MTAFGQAGLRAGRVNPWICHRIVYVSGGDKHVFRSTLIRAILISEVLAADAA